MECQFCEGSGVITFQDGSEQICSCSAGDQALADMAAPPPHPNFVPWSQEAIDAYTQGRLKPGETPDFS